MLRQGDVFVIQARASQRELLTTGGTLVGSRHVNDSHTATNVIAMPDGTLYARGIMRHRPAGRRAEHHNLELWDRRIWGRIVLNTVPRSFSNRSWSLGGAVD